MQSGGGIATAEAMARFPVRMIESGPAAGALMAAAYGKLTGHADLVAFDMGGTTAKLSLIAGGAPQTIREFELHRIRLQPGSGIPMNIQAIDLVEIGAGGGSIARAEMGVIQVGPDSAGAAPGPICYGLGGTEPTVTDANLVLGYLNPDYFLGGRMRLDVEGARRGIEAHVARPLGLGGRGGRVGHPPGRDDQHGAGHAGRVDRARVRSAAARPRPRSAARAPSTAAGSPRRSASPARSCRRPRA